MITSHTMDDAEVYRLHADELTAFATSIVGPHDAPDMVSAAVLAAFSSSGWSRVENRRAYLYRTVYNECLRVTRRRAERTRRERLAARPRDVHLPDFRPDVADAVRALSPQQRAVVVLTYWQDLPIHAVAEYLGVSDGSVRKHLARARAHLREALHD